MSIRMSPNQREVLSAISTVTGKQEFLKSTDGYLNTTGSGGSGSGSTQYVEGVTTSPATGTVSLARNTSGALVPLQLDASNNLKISGSLTVGGTTDNSAYTAGTSTGTPAMGLYHSTIDTVTDGRAAALGMTSKRALYVNLQNAAGSEIGTALSPLRVDLTGTTTQPVSISAVVDTASNDNVTTGNITAADIGSTSSSGQGGQVLWSGTPTANSQVNLAFPTVNGSPESQSNVVIYISGTFVGTYVLERSPDNGTSWTSFNCFIAGTADQINTGTLPGMFHGNVAGTTNIRVRCTSYTSGTIAVRLTSGIGTGTITVGNPIKLYDGSSKVQATIKAASTAPVATDTALVVAVRDAVPITTSLPSAIINGQKAASTTAASLGTGPLTQGVIIESLSTNTVSVFIGGVGVTASTGIELLPGASTSVAVSNISSIYIISASGTPVVSWLGS